jgi:hypothetical protein
MTENQPTIDPDTGFNIALAHQMARDIELANQINPNSWTIISADDRPFLNVANLNVISISGPSTSYSYLISLEGISGQAQSAAQQYFDAKRTYATRSWAQNLRLDDAAVIDHAEVLEYAHVQAVKQLAGETKWRANRWKEHRPAFLEQLAHVVGHSLPEPGYADELLLLNAQSDQGQLTDTPFEASPNPDRRYWKVEIGSKGTWLPIMSEHNCILLDNWSTEPLDLAQLPTDHDAFVRDATKLPSIGKPNADHLWRFAREIAIGDLVVPFGPKKTYGWGEVIGDYEHQVDEHQLEHRRAVVWRSDLTNVVKLPNLSTSLRDALWGIGPRELTAEQFGEAIGSSISGLIAPNAPSPDASQPASEVTDPTPEAAGQMAKTILAAHDISPNCWAVYASNHRMVVMVGNVAAGGSWQVGKYDTLMVRDALESDVAEHLAASPVPKIPKDYPTLIFPQVPDTTSEGDFLSWQQAHEDALKVVTNPYKKAVLWQSHREDLRHRIASIAGVELPRPGYVPAPVTLKIVRDQFAASGLAYTVAQVATFITALQTKGFVVLSGISGTGKSKIATGFVEMLPKSSATNPIVSDTTGLIPITIKPYMQTYKRIILPSRQVDLLPPMPIDTQHEVPVSLDDTRGDGRIEHRSHGTTSVTVLYLRGQIGKNFGNVDVGTNLYLQPVISNDGEKIERVELLRPDQLQATESSEETPASNHLFLSVRPDWRDSTSLLGYYNPLTQTYEWTGFLRFILQAAENYKGPVADRIAWFVILDEMNLAHVEYYFADLLSVLESGRNNEGWTSQPLRTTYPDLIADDDVPEHEIYLPPNLYIIGTVNMDETTHAFSPKVLDRAFTIELTDVDFSHYPPATQGSESAGLNDDQRRALLLEFARNGQFHRIDKDEIAEVVVLHPEIRTHLQNLNRELQRDRFHFGYRVFDEIAQYIAVNDETGLMPFPEAFDWAVFMKVLPKFSGSLARLRSPLTSLLAWAIKPMQPDVSGISALVQAQSVSIDGATYPIVAKRAQQMLEALYTDGFVSFG